MPGPACTSPPLPVMTLPKLMPCVTLSLRLNASVALSVIGLTLGSEPKLPPLPICSVPAVILVEPL